jgi:hypothetical protein
VHLAENGLEWLDSTRDGDFDGFYRLSLPPADPAMEPVDDFLLLDHEGEARELFYPANLKALVVIAAGGSISGLDPVLTAVRPLVLQYGSTNIAFWVLLNDPTATRTNIADHVQASGADVRVLFDPDGLGTLALRTC